MGICKCRKSTGLFCFVHKKAVCTSCVVDHPLVRWMILLTTLHTYNCTTYHILTNTPQTTQHVIAQHSTQHTTHITHNTSYHTSYHNPTHITYHNTHHTLQHTPYSISRCWQCTIRTYVEWLRDSEYTPPTCAVCTQRITADTAIRLLCLRMCREMQRDVGTISHSHTIHH